jgi:hypothetical protein
MLGMSKAVNDDIIEYVQPFNLYDPAVEGIDYFNPGGFMQKVSLISMSQPTTGVIPWSITISRQQSFLLHLLMFFAARLQSSVRNPLKEAQMDMSTAMMETHKALFTTKQPVTMLSSTTMHTGSATHATHQHKDMATSGKTRLSPFQVLT